MQQLIERAQAAGELRSDVVYEDISVLLWTTGRVVDATREVDARVLAAVPRARRRRTARPGATPLPQPPLTAAKHRQAMTRFAEHRVRTFR